MGQPGKSPSVSTLHSHTGSNSLQFRINVTAQVFFTLALLPLLEKGTEKKVVNVTSMLGDLIYSAENPHLQFASYSASKAGITMANLKFHNEYVFTS
jgi:NAD(P)-dependent dehydrogenase (short-subunit alcohol dehydrogenase family)